MDKSLETVLQLNRTARGLSKSIFREDDSAPDLNIYGINTSASIEDPCVVFNGSDASYTRPSDIFQFVVYGILMTTVGLLGIAGNIISITILVRMKSSINCCLAGLAVFDTMLTISSIVMLALPEISLYTRTTTWHTFIQKTMPFVYPIGLIAQTGSIYLTVTVTIERFVAVCLPFKRRTFCTYGRARIYVLAVALFSIVYNLPRFWEVAYKECHFDDKKEIIIYPSSLRSNPHYLKVYIMWMYLVVIYLIPFFSLLILNSFIFSKVRSANLEMQRLSSMQRNQIGLATMLLVVVAVFFVCNVLALIINVLENISREIADELLVASNFLVTINSSVNFIIYCTFGQKFRQIFLKQFCSRFAPLPTARMGTIRPGEGPHNGRLTESIRLTSYSEHRPNPLLNLAVERTSPTHFTYVPEAEYWKRDLSCLSFDHFQTAKFQ